jgi:hypothetical protein
MSSRHWYICFGVNIQPGDGYPPSFSYNHGDDWSAFVWDACAQDTEQQDGFGLPGAHDCGTEGAIATTTAYLG